MEDKDTMNWKKMFGMLGEDGFKNLGEDGFKNIINSPTVADDIIEGQIRSHRNDLIMVLKMIRESIVTDIMTDHTQSILNSTGKDEDYKNNLYKELKTANELSKLIRYMTDETLRDEGA